MRIQTTDIIRRFSEYFAGRDDVTMAFLFGSWARGNVCVESDMDVAVYFKSSREASGDEEFASEDEVWGDIERICGREVDLLILNRAAPFVAFSAVRGIPLVIKDRNLYISFLFNAMTEALDYQEFVESWWRMKRGRANAASSGR